MSRLTDELQATVDRVIREALSQCEPEQVAFFHKLWPNGVSQSTAENAYGVIERTIIKNRKRKEADRG